MLSKNDLLNLRNKINDIDENIVDLLAKRKKLVLKIAESKIKNNQPIRDIEREKSLLTKLIKLGKKNNLDTHYITRLFQLIIEESVSTQKKILNNFCNYNKLHLSTFSFLGPKGSYSHIAASQYAERNFKTCIEKTCLNFEEVVKSVENNEADYAVLPIENSCSGFINEIFDILKKTNLFIVGEINVFINHCLLAIKKIELNKIKKIYSHSQPFEQCSYFINQFPNWNIQYTNSTADAMKKITKYNIITNAAIGSEIGSKIYGLKILSKNLANKKKNITRFILLSRKSVTFSSNIPTKTTLIFSTSQESGALAKVLLILQKKKLIMKKLTSKNIYKNPWEEMFYIDIQANLSSTLMKEALEKIKKITKFIKILGCYPSENITPIIP